MQKIFAHTHLDVHCVLNNRNLQRREIQFKILLHLMLLRDVCGHQTEKKKKTEKKRRKITNRL